MCSKSRQIRNQVAPNFMVRKFSLTEKFSHESRNLFLIVRLPTYFQKTNPGDLRICWNRILLISDVKSMVKGLLHIGNLFPLTSVKIRMYWHCCLHPIFISNTPVCHPIRIEIGSACYPMQKNFIFLRRILNLLDNI